MPDLHTSTHIFQCSSVDYGSPQPSALTLSLNPALTYLNPDLTCLDPALTCLNPALTCLNPALTYLVVLGRSGQHGSVGGELHGSDQGLVASKRLDLKQQRCQGVQEIRCCRKSVVTRNQGFGGIRGGGTGGNGSVGTHS